MFLDFSIISLYFSAQDKEDGRNEGMSTER